MTDPWVVPGQPAQSVVSSTGGHDGPGESFPARPVAASWSATGLDRGQVLRLVGSA